MMHLFVDSGNFGFVAVEHASDQVYDVLALAPIDDVGLCRADHDTEDTIVHTLKESALCPNIDNIFYVAHCSNGILPAAIWLSHTAAPDSRPIHLSILSDRSLISTGLDR